MSRLPSPSEPIEVRPTSNVYTAIVAIAVLVTIIGLVLLWMQSVALHGQPPFPMGS